MNRHLARSIEKLLDDDLTQAVMRADHVDRASLEALIVRVQRSTGHEPSYRHRSLGRIPSRIYAGAREAAQSNPVTSAVVALWDIGSWTNFGLLLASKLPQCVIGAKPSAAR